MIGYICNAHAHILRLAFDDAIKYNMRREIYCGINNLYCGDMLFGHDVIGVCRRCRRRHKHRCGDERRRRGRDAVRCG